MFWQNVNVSQNLKCCEGWKMLHHMPKDVHAEYHCMFSILIHVTFPSLWYWPIGMSNQRMSCPTKASPAVWSIRFILWKIHFMFCFIYNSRQYKKFKIRCSPLFNYSKQVLKVADWMHWRRKMEKSINFHAFWQID